LKAKNLARAWWRAHCVVLAATRANLTHASWLLNLLEDQFQVLSVSLGGGKAFSVRRVFLRRSRRTAKLNSTGAPRMNATSAANVITAVISLHASQR
jgi:hypothetical protein